MRRSEVTNALEVPMKGPHHGGRHQLCGDPEQVRALRSVLRRPAGFRADCRPVGLVASAAESAAAAEGGSACASVATVSFETRRTLLTLPPLSRRLVYALLVVHRPSMINCAARGETVREASR